jgi:hypothetical protein
MTPQQAQLLGISPEVLAAMNTQQGQPGQPGSIEVSPQDLSSLPMGNPGQPQQSPISQEDLMMLQQQGQQPQQAMQPPAMQQQAPQQIQPATDPQQQYPSDPNGLMNQTSNADIAAAEAAASSGVDPRAMDQSMPQQAPQIQSQPQSDPNKFPPFNVWAQSSGFPKSVSPAVFEKIVSNYHDERSKWMEMNSPDAKRKALKDELELQKLMHERSMYPAIDAEAANKVAESNQKKDDAFIKKNADLQDVDFAINQIDTLAQHPGMDWSVGKVSALPTFPGSDSANFLAKYNNIKGTLTLNARQKLAGQGSLSDMESKMAANAASDLSTGQSKDEFLKSLGVIRANLMAGRNRLANQVESMRPIDTRAGVQSSPTQMGSVPTAPMAPVAPATGAGKPIVIGPGGKFPAGTYVINPATGKMRRVGN